jgi:Ca2+-binding RTX toxin-like protein
MVSPVWSVAVPAIGPGVLTDLPATGLPVASAALPDAASQYQQGGGSASVLIGGDGDDLLIGSAGRDLLVGGLAHSPTCSTEGDPVLSVGTTEAGHHDLALHELLAEWTAAKDAQNTSVWLDDSPFRTDKLADSSATLDVLTGNSDPSEFFTDGAIDRAT